MPNQLPRENNAHGQRCSLEGKPFCCPNPSLLWSSSSLILALTFLIPCGIAGAVIFAILHWSR